MKDKKDKILYIGKAKNLKKRLSQYFLKKGGRGKNIDILLPQIKEISTIETTTEKEALILESNLIKQHRPKYNILLKDDKSFITIVITDERWPLLKVVRKKAGRDENYFGPYPHARAAKATIDLLIRLFKFRQCSKREFEKRKRPCILYEIKKCLAPCVGLCSHEEYKKNVEYAKKILKGESKEIIKELKKKMNVASDGLRFEEAEKFSKMVKMINHIQEVQHVDNLISKNLDAIGIYRENSSLSISKLMFRENRLIGSYNFNFENILTEDTEEIVQTFLVQHYRNNLPAEILVDLRKKETISKIISKKKRVKITEPKRGEKKRLMEMAYKNAKSQFFLMQKKKLEKESLLFDLQKILLLKNFPKEIVCFDVSSLSQTSKVAAKVSYINGKEEPSKTKLFKIKTEKKGDIYAIYEAIFRFLKRAIEEKKMPDLIMIDGGAAHLKIAKKAVEDLLVTSIDLIAISKEKSRHDRGLSQEKVHIIDKKEPIILDRRSPILFLLQRIRDASHRKALLFLKKREKKKITLSALDEIQGIGDIRKNRLLYHFKSLEAIKKASLEEIAKAAKISKTLAKEIKLSLLKKSTSC